MVTVGDIIDRIYRDYLIPPASQPARFQVGQGGINASSTTLPVNVSMLSPEEQDKIGPGLAIEVESEMMLVTGVTGGITSLTVQRGMYGTTAAPHNASTPVTIAPKYPRRVVFDALADAIEALWPDLYTIRSTEVYTDSMPVELPEACEEIIEVRAGIGDGWNLVGSWEFLSPFPGVDSGKAIQFGLGAGVGCPVYVVYKAATIRPETEADELENLNVEPGWAKVAAVGAVAHVVANEDIDRLTVEFITQALANEGYTIGQGTDLRNGLLQYQQFLMGPLQRSLEKRTPTQVVVHHMF